MLSLNGRRDSGFYCLKMNWLNINTTHMRDPLWVKSDATQRGAWLSMLGYCTERETNGIIVGSRLWTDRQWIHSTGLMAAEVGDSSLWRWVGDDLHLELYPHEMQSMVVARREGGRKGGQAKTEAKANASQMNGKAKLNPSLTQAQPKLNPSLSQPNSNSKGKGNSKGKEQVEVEEQVEEQVEEEVKSEVESEAEPEAPIPADATADPADAHTALRAVADLGVEYFRLEGKPDIQGTRPSTRSRQSERLGCRQPPKIHETIFHQLAKPRARPSRAGQRRRKFAQRKTPEIWVVTKPFSSPTQPQPNHNDTNRTTNAENNRRRNALPNVQCNLHYRTT